MKFIVYILFFFPLVASAVDHGPGVAGMDKYGYTVWYSGSRFTSSIHSGNPDVTQSGTGYTFTHHDTLTFTGSGFTNVPTVHDVSGDGNFIDGYGATVTNTSFQQLGWDNVSGMTVAGFVCTNYWATITMHKYHDCKILDVKVTNTGANRHDQPFLNFDYSANSDMVFTGSLAQTYYRDSVVGCRFDGYSNAGGVIRCGTSWDGGSDGGIARDNRGIMVSPRFLQDTIANVLSTGGAGIIAISGTGPDAWFINCHFYSIDGVGSFNGSHNESVLWYGYITVDGGGQNDSYASMIRNLPLQWNGLAGYSGHDANHTRIQNTLIKHNLSYSGHELTNQGAGDRTSNGFSFRRAEVIHNTIDSTTGLSYNGPARYNGRGVDLVGGFDSAFIEGMVVFRPEQDYASVPYSTDSTAHNGYIYAEVGSAATHLTVRNNYSARYSTGKVVDSTLYKPSLGSPLIGGVTTYPGYTKDRYGVTTTTDKGAVAYVSGAPPCTTNTLPGPGVTVAGVLSTVVSVNPAAGATFYDWYVYTGGTPPGSPTTSTSGPSAEITGLTSATVYHYFAIPGNVSGSASGCAISNTQFTTGVVVPPSTIIRNKITVQH